MHKHKVITSLLIVFFLSGNLFSQLNEPGRISGNVQLLFQQYNEDTLIGAEVPAEKAALNAFGNLIYNKGSFSAGIRFESYLPAVNGYPVGFNGSGIGYRFARYKHQNFDVTIGNFYEQFGSGMTLRSYEDRQLGFDNSLDGFRMVYTPLPGVTLKGVYGTQRIAFDSRLINGEGLVRGFDGELSINDLFSKKLGEKKTRVSIGGSFVSKFQTGGVIEKDSLFLNLPENVGSYGGRLNVIRQGFTFMGEYVEKINDPSADNGFIYKDGKGILVETGYSRKGFGILFGGKMIDNMSYRSDRNLGLLQAPINFLPAITRQHTHNLAATLYPYATVINGESSAMGEIYYKIKKGSKIGGKYGTSLRLNVAAANSLDSTALRGVDGTVDGYKTNSVLFGSEKFIRDVNFEIKRKISKDLTLGYTYYYLEFNTGVTVVSTDFIGLVYADIHVLEGKYKIKPKNTIRWELQSLSTDQDQGDWATALIEYNWSPHWFISILDQYNYGNPSDDEKIHYLYGTVGYINGSNRISVGYGKRRAGIFCVGGVCRPVPASNGLEITITSSF